ncbi:MAG: GTPase HflX [Acidimicrobiia bacterium]|nr:GTPase HflX [Acidimicrobiia bacterium]
MKFNAENKNKRYHQNRDVKRLTQSETDFDVIVQKAVIVALDWSGVKEDIELSLDELGLLVDTAGAKVIYRETQKLDHPNVATFIGKGKAEELSNYIAANDIDVAVFDSELSPAQQRNLEEILKVDVVDRVGVILDIFALHATTKEGMKQVEVAQLKYLMPRLRGKGTSLSQQGGGIGTRGPGETKLETDRRKITKRLAKLEEDLKKLEKVRSTQRKSREKLPQKRVSIVGYTNAGKSTLLNALSKSDAHVEDRLFATLAPTTRKLYVGEDGNYKPKVILCSDTVGFVRNLPHQLIEAFRSTLEEVAGSQLLVHCVDASSDDVLGNIEAVNKVLDDIEVGDIEQIILWNKIDRLSDDQLDKLKEIDFDYKSKNKKIKDSFFLSAITGQGVEILRDFFLKHPSL